MGLYTETNKTARIIFVSLAMMATAAQLPVAFSGESVAAARSLKTQSSGPTATHKSAPAFRSRTENINSASGTWNRTPSRSAGLWTSSQVDSKNQSNIRFASASGMDEGVSSAIDPSISQETNDPAINTDKSPATATDTAETLDETSTPAASSVSVKEQLLNALRMQRQAITSPNALKSTTTPGSLTIMNSPQVTPKSPVESTRIDSPPSATRSTSETAAATNQTNMAVEDEESALQPKSAKPFAGLTKTLEEDLKSDNAYLRERAQRLLRLQKQILQLRSRQAADAETATQTTTTNTEDISNQDNSGTAVAATQPLNPSRESTPGSNDGASKPADTEQHPSAENASSQNSNAPNAHTSNQQTPPEENIADENLSEESAQGPAVHSANASLLENVVVDGPIDRLGLANNLFAVGEYPLALEMYQQTAGPELSSQQQFWVEYQLANCLRHLGNTAEASNQFRKLASQPEAGWLSQKAHWWVEILERKRIVEKSLKDNSVEQSRIVIEDVEAAFVEPPAENTATSTVSESSKSLEPAKDEQTN